jgi:hypothetical protein
MWSGVDRNNVMWHMTVIRSDYISAHTWCSLVYAVINSSHSTCMRHPLQARSKILTASQQEIQVLFSVTLCCWVGSSWCSAVSQCLHLKGPAAQDRALMMKTPSFLIISGTDRMTTVSYPMRLQYSLPLHIASLHDWFQGWLDLL